MSSPGQDGLLSTLLLSWDTLRWSACSFTTEQTRGQWSNSLYYLDQTHTFMFYRLKNNQGKTPGDLAKERNKTEVCLKIQEFTEDNQRGITSEDSLCEVSREGKDDKDALLTLNSSEVTNILECPVCLDTMIKVSYAMQWQYGYHRLFLSSGSNLSMSQWTQRV